MKTLKTLLVISAFLASSNAFGYAAGAVCAGQSKSKVSTDDLKRIALLKGESKRAKKNGKPRQHKRQKSTGRG